MALPAVVDELGEGLALEFAKIWRVAQARTKRPIKFGSVSAQVAASVLDVQTSKYKPTSTTSCGTWQRNSTASCEHLSLLGAR